MNIQQASIYSGKSEKTLRRWIHNWKQGRKGTSLPAFEIEGRYDIQASDLDALWVRPAPDTLSTRIRDLERRVSDVEATIAQISNNSPTARKQPQRLIHPQNDASASAILPEGLVPLNELMKQHGLERQRKAIIAYLEKQGKLHRGDWTLSGHAVNLALDSSGVEEFERRYVK